jgi:hypothetical protein
VRRDIECAIGLDSATRNGQTKPLTATVWRVVEPALVQRDAQLDAVADVVTAMEGVTGARFWAQQLRTALQIRQPTADPEVQPPLSWCGASMAGLGGDPIGPCILRAGHDGPVHQAANGAKWWPTTDPQAEDRAVVRSVTEAQLHAAIRTMARADPAWWTGVLDRMARIAGKEKFLG